MYKLHSTGFKWNSLNIKLWNLIFPLTKIDLLWNKTKDCPFDIPQMNYSIYIMLNHYLHQSECWMACWWNDTSWCEFEIAPMIHTRPVFKAGWYTECCKQCIHLDKDADWATLMRIEQHFYQHSSCSSSTSHTNTHTFTHFNTTTVSMTTEAKL